MLDDREKGLRGLPSRKNVLSYEYLSGFHISGNRCPCANAPKLWESHVCVTLTRVNRTNLELQGNITVTIRGEIRNG